MRISLLYLIVIYSFLNAANAVEYSEARHLLARTGFGGSVAEIDALSDLAYEQAVDQLLRTVRIAAVTAPPAWIHEALPNREKRTSMNPEERKTRRKLMRDRAVELKAWWYGEMIKTPSPLTENMTLFWHNHFTSSARKVKWIPFLYEQNRLLRKHALGNYGALLREVSRDPAMLIYLDNAKSRKENPNENFARELLELFTLGEGHYTENDIKAAARAFTGWTVDRKKGGFRFVRRWHDNGSKTFLGHTGDLDGDDIIRILLEQDQLAIHVTSELWQAMVSPDPDTAEIKRLAAIFRNAGYEMKPLVRAMLLSEGFRDPENRGTLVKSPVDFLVGTLRLLEMQPCSGRPLVMASRRLGQDLFDPPNVKGWPGGNSWISSDTLLVRQQLASRLTRGMEMPGACGGKRKLMVKSNGTSSILVRVTPDTVVSETLLPLVPVRARMNSADRLTNVAELMQDPVYQLK